jgi:hypothetical protein
MSMTAYSSSTTGYSPGSMPAAPEVDRALVAASRPNAAPSIVPASTDVASA